MSGRARRQRPLEVGAPRVPVARGAFYVRWRDAEPADAALEVPRGGFLTLTARNARGALAFEALARGGQDVLLALAASADVRVNGLAAPRVTSLRDGDEIALAGEPPLVVRYERASPFVRADAELARATCPLCRGAVVAGRRVFRCECGAVLHADEADASSLGASEPLDCAQGACAACGRRIDPPAPLGGSHAPPH